MSINFKIHQKIPDQEVPLLYHWGTDIFGGSIYNLHWRPPEVHVIGYIDSKPVTHVGILKHQIVVGSNKIWVGGIGGVVTIPQVQKNGFAKQCLLRAQEYMVSDLSVEFGFLFCPDRMQKYYAGLGWHNIDEKVIIDQPTGKITAPLCSMVYVFSKPWPKGSVELGSLPW